MSCVKATESTPSRPQAFPHATRRFTRSPSSRSLPTAPLPSCRNIGIVTPRTPHKIPHGHGARGHPPSPAYTDHRRDCRPGQPGGVSKTQSPLARIPNQPHLDHLGDFRTRTRLSTRYLLSSTRLRLPPPPTCTRPRVTPSPRHLHVTHIHIRPSLAVQAQPIPIHTQPPSPASTILTTLLPIHSHLHAPVPTPSHTASHLQTATSGIPSQISQSWDRSYPLVAKVSGLLAPELEPLWYFSLSRDGRSHLGCGVWGVRGSCAYA